MDERGLVVLACEVGGRFSEECRHFLCQLSKFLARDEPLLLQQRGATRLASPLGVDVGVQRGSCSGLVVVGATGRAWRGWTSTSEP